MFVFFFLNEDSWLENAQRRDLNSAGESAAVTFDSSLSSSAKVTHLRQGVRLRWVTVGAPEGVLSDPRPKTASFTPPLLVRSTGFAE